MSIINDAIKKARKESDLKNTSDKGGFREGRNPPPSVTVSSVTKSSEIKWLVVIVISLTVIVSLFGSMFLYRHIVRGNRPYPSVAKKSTPLRPKPMAKKVVRPYDRFEDTVDLNGIVYEHSDKWAIINDKIAREGDLLPSGKLILIEKDYVKIEKDDGQEIVLNLR